MTYHYEPRRPTINEFLRSRGIQIQMRELTHAELLNRRINRFVTNYSERKSIWQRVLDQIRDSNSYI